MALLTKTNNTLARFRRDESGAFSMMWGVCAAVFIGVMGAAVDFAMLSNANSRAQAVADTTALAAAIYVKDNEIIPTDRNQGLIGDYTAYELGYRFKNWVIDGGNGVTVQVVYNEANREAVVTTFGKTRPIFMQIFGYDELDFNAKTVVKFLEKEPLDPASVVLIMDNSGSMEFDDIPLVNGVEPSDATVRMDGLIASSKSFMNILNDTVGPQDGSVSGPRVLRTGMMAYDSNILPERTVDMEWGTEWATGPADKLSLMEPKLATNSAPPLETAYEWLAGTGSNREPAIHLAEDPNAKPLKYLILMTDGKNTIGTQQWVARPGTQNWRAWVQTGSHMEFIDEYEVVNAFVPGGSCRWRNGYPRQNYTYTYSYGYTGTFNTTWRVECKKQVEVPDYGWEYRQQTDEPNEPGDWEEGEFDISSNIETRRQCDALHDAGVEIFSVGFALVPGQFATNAWANRQGGFTPYPRDQNYTYEESVKDTNIAKGLLQYCATKDENFISADDTAALEAAFERIGNTIVKEIIRIDS